MYFFTVTFDQFSVSLQNKIIVSSKKITSKLLLQTFEH